MSIEDSNSTGYALSESYQGEAFAAIDFKGELIPCSWFHYIKKPRGTPHMPAALLLGELLHVHRPIREIDPVSKQSLPLRKKFAHDFYYVNYSKWAETMCVSQRQLRASLQVLAEHGLLRLRRDYGKEHQHVRGTGVYVELCPEQISKITYLLDESNLYTHKKESL